MIQRSRIDDSAGVFFDLVHTKFHAITKFCGGPPFLFYSTCPPFQDCSAIGNGDQVSPGAEAGEPAVAPKCAAGTSRAGTKVSASVFREFEVEVRPEPPPPPEAPDGRTAEDTLMGQMGLDGAGVLVFD